MSESVLQKNSSAASRLQAGVIIALLIILIGGLSAWATGLRPTPRWEYLIESPSDLSFEGTINLRGKEGWELVTARRATSRSESDGSASYEMIFKRPLQVQ